MIQAKNATPRNKGSQKPHRKPLSHGGQRCPRNVSWWKEEKRQETRQYVFANEGSCRPFRHAIMAQSAIKSMDRWIACQLDGLGRIGRPSLSFSGMFSIARSLSGDWRDRNIAHSNVGYSIDSSERP